MTINNSIPKPKMVLVNSKIDTHLIAILSKFFVCHKLVITKCGRKSDVRLNS